MGKFFFQDTFVKKGDPEFFFLDMGPVWSGQRAEKPTFCLPRLAPFAGGYEICHTNFNTKERGKNTGIYFFSFYFLYRDLFS